MSELILSNDFKSIVLNNKPMIDVRAPVEFKLGAFPNAVNFPILNDEERHLIGIHYKEAGNAEAIKLGHELVSGQKKEDRISLWCNFKKCNPEAMLYCFRGGKRSEIAQQWMAENGVEIVRLKGGYKAFRNSLIVEMEQSSENFKPIVMGGRTGSGKTILLKKIQNSIDLEAIANHRGSSFGRKITPQPTQINFENTLAYDLIQKIHKGFKYLIFEDEGKHIGSAFMPSSLKNYLIQAPLVILETPINERIDITFEEYVVEAQKKYVDAGYSDALNEWKNDILNAMKRIARKLGGERYNRVGEIFDNAFREQERSGSQDAYKEWVDYLLREYYDPMYDYQIQKRSALIEFRGSDEEILAHFQKSKFTQ